jgi:exosortase/archaeosortase family protein
VSPTSRRWAPDIGTYVDAQGRPLRRLKRPWYWRWPFGVRVAIFLGVFSGLQLLWEAVRGGSFEYTVIHDWTVQPAARLVNLLTPEIHASAMKFSIQATGGGLNVLNGCEGSEGLFLLLAAFLVAPLGWRSRVLGILTGAPVMFVINQGRILVLFYAYRADHALFDVLHATVTPVAVILLVAAYFYSWLVYANRATAKAA